MKISEMTPVIQVRGWQLERHMTHNNTGEPFAYIWRVVDGETRDERYPDFVGRYPKPLTQWYRTKISALRAAMYLLEEQQHG